MTVTFRDSLDMTPKIVRKRDVATKFYDS